MTALDEAACVLAKLHPGMWACSSCGWRSDQAIAADNAERIRTEIAEHPACTLCRRVGDHDPSCLVTFAGLLDEGRTDRAAPPAPHPHPHP